MSPRFVPVQTNTAENNFKVLAYDKEDSNGFFLIMFCLPITSMKFPFELSNLSF